MGPSGREAIIKKLPNLIKKKKLDFVIVNGENAADPGVGITKKNTEEFFEAGTDVITTGNHVWDQKETMEFITSEKRFLRPENLIEGSPGVGTGIFISKSNKLHCFFLIPNMIASCNYISSSLKKLLSVFFSYSNSRICCILAINNYKI